VHWVRTRRPRPTLAGTPPGRERFAAQKEIPASRGLHFLQDVPAEGNVKILALEIAEREPILTALEDPPAELAELCGVLLREFEWRRAEGLSRASRTKPTAATTN
jgi:hypothetical protein